MRFGLIYHHQLPRPWAEDSEERLYNEALEQIELADRLGLDYAWATEHHFFEEYSHSSAPEVFLAAAAARTKNIRLAHGIVHMPPAVNHPARIAERLGVLDLISGGRLDFGSGQGSSQLEVGAFGIELKDKYEQWHEALEVVVRMMTETPFTGHEGTWVNMPPRNVVPKPKQKPHPPLWRACTRRDSIQDAAREGMGALAFSFVNPEEAKEWVDAYYGTLASQECRPLGHAVNANVAMVLPFMCHEDEEVALDRGLEAAHFFSYSLMHYYMTGEHRPGVTDIWAEFQAAKESLGFTRTPAAAPAEGDEQSGVEQAMMDQVGMLRRGIGTPEQIRDIIRRYEAVGVDQIIFSVQIGKNRHEHIMESLELFAREVMPEFVEGRDRKEAEKAERLSVPIKEALGRVEHRTADVSEFSIAPELSLPDYQDDDDDD
ncbi:LLM class flavin-dependent oxidoreductase [Streptomyces sp. WI03-4A]|uniref:LLM class flavin-dependent oxidoreductase n=1 Tax=Streptomyces TaxID=1883 RepID=UPI0029A3AC07|nr:LLM class flavin-dependent oxidoreductase [Streptomyces sp. WI03-4A]MDX2592754.1 LLM class flavin-dependent oxidoreductase [Streptomyces sp. WI03-4A]